MSYRNTRQPSWTNVNTGTSAEEDRVAHNGPRADYPVSRPARGCEEACDEQPSLITAIAHELSTIEGGTTAEHLSGARQLLEEAFRAVEQLDDVTRNDAGRTSSGNRRRTCELEPASAA